MNLFSKVLSKLEEYIVGTLLFIMVTVAFVNVITRYLIKYPLAFTEELEVGLFVWVVVLGSAIAIRKGSHLSVKLLYNTLSPQKQRLLRIIADLISITLFMFIAYYGILELRDEIEMNILTESLEIPVVYYTSAVPIGSAIMIIRLLEDIFKKGGQ